MPQSSKFHRITMEYYWDDPALQDCFRHGLHDDVNDLLLTISYPHYLANLIKRAVPCDNCLFGRRQER